MPRHSPNALISLNRSHHQCSHTRRGFSSRACARFERTLIQKDQLASRSCQRCLRSGSHRHYCGARKRFLVRELLVTISSSRCQTTRSLIDYSTRRAELFLFGRTISHGLNTKTWWSQTGSNRRPPACKAGALPTELWPRFHFTVHFAREGEEMVGLGRLELPTSRLSSARSNQLSYKPKLFKGPSCSAHGPPAIKEWRRGFVRKKEKRRRRRPANRHPSYDEDPDVSKRSNRNT